MEKRRVVYIFLVVKTKGRRQLGKHMHRWGIILK
jgi:hypothetical protein